MTSVKLINHSSSTADWNYLLIYRIISDDKQSCTYVLTYQRTNNPGSALGIRRGQNIPRFGQQVKNTFFWVYLATASSRCSGKSACVAD